MPSVFISRGILASIEGELMSVLWAVSYNLCKGGLWVAAGEAGGGGVKEGVPDIGKA